MGCGNANALIAAVKTLRTIPGMIFYLRPQSV
jgi:hypothetical protein